ncbi:hypothetical protein [Nonomuraea sp. bgisy101]|uniref:hypothetical protein n=1 Tax=Nonomuraea sp. bgisy101 TaxID=3413784 RepID=UPI003D70881B
MTHQPWCTQHSERVCMSDTVNGVTITWAPGESTTVWLDEDSDSLVDFGLSLEAARRAARTILAWFPDAPDSPS